MIANKKIKKSTCHIRGVYSLPPILALEFESRHPKNKKKDYVFFKQLNKRGNWFKIFSKKTREFNTTELYWKGCNLRHWPGTILPSKNIHKNTYH